MPQKLKVITAVSLIILITTLTLWIIIKPSIRLAPRSVSPIEKVLNAPSLVATTSSETGQSNNEPVGTSCVNMTDLNQRQACMAQLNQALKADSGTACASLATEQDRQVCQNAQSLKAAEAPGTISSCSSLTESQGKTRCLEQAALNLAVTTRNKAYCEELISVKDQTFCKQAVSNMEKVVESNNNNVDVDNDGLSNAEEAKYGTNPQNPDTDSDGKSDGAEVKAGFNPCGEGKLPVERPIKSCAKYRLWLQGQK